MLLFGFVYNKRKSITREQADGVFGVNMWSADGVWSGFCR
jgi:hypothetical protein